MEYWYKNTVVVIGMLIFAIILEYLKGRKVESMFLVNDIKKESSSIGSVLLIIAHPDDEIMFYTPTIKTLLSFNIQIKILCLSNGNFYGLGELREKEFDNLSRHLNLPYNQIINIPELQDNINKKWDSAVVSQQIEEYLKENEDVKTILTFDEKGITKHPNHISCFNGLQYYLNKNSDECKRKGINVYTLDSFNFFFQYTIFAPLFYSLIKPYGYYTMTFVNSFIFVI